MTVRRLLTIMNDRTGRPQFVFLANNAALDFVNTEVMVDGVRKSLLSSYTDVSSWLVNANHLEKDFMQSVEMEWTEEEKQVLVETALDLRSRLRTAIGEMVAGSDVSLSFLDFVNEIFRKHNGYVQVAITEKGYVRRLHFSPKQPIDLLAPLAEAVSDLLCSIDPKQIRKCENPACILYFYDNSKNHTRRWCSMNTCGNRMKAAAHYGRVKTKRVASAGTDAN